MNKYIPRDYLLEGFAIIISILIAFGIDAWWEDIKERDLASRYMCALSSEIDLTVMEISNDLESLVEIDEGLQRYLHDAPLGSVELQSMLSAAIYVPNIAPPRAVQDELIETGGNRLLGMEDLSTDLMSLRQMMRKNEINETSQRNFVQNRFIPVLSDLLPLDGVLGPAKTEGFSDANSIDAVQASQEFRNIILERQYALRRGLRRVSATLSLSETIRDNLQSLPCN
ncbi:MAG: hypothetical protein ABJN62_07140 [Halioglobus sp.]